MTIDFVDATILFLLIATVGYAAMVDRRVRALMTALEGLAPTVAALSAAADRTETSVGALKVAAGDLPHRVPAAPVPEAATASPEGIVVRAAVKSDLIRRFFDGDGGAIGAVDAGSSRARAGQRA